MGIDRTPTPYTIFRGTAHNVACVHDDEETIVAESANDASQQFREEHDEWEASLIVIGEAINEPQRRIAAVYRGPNV